MRDFTAPEPKPHPRATRAQRDDAHREKMERKKAARRASVARANAYFDSPQRRLDAIDEAMGWGAGKAVTESIPTISDEAAEMMRQTVDYMNTERSAEELMADLNATAALMMGMRRGR